MEDNFESRKNIQASGYTAMVCVLLLIVFLYVRWTLPNIPPPPEEEGIEVNLGNSDQGFGDDQPFLPGKPSPSDNQSYTPPVKINTPAEEIKDFETDDKDEEAPAVIKPPVTKPNATKIPEKEIVKTVPVKKPQVSNDPPAPVPPKPKAVFKGVNGTGTGGNEADTYKKGGNQGIAGGRGDQVLQAAIRTLIIIKEAVQEIPVWQFAVGFQEEGSCARLRLKTILMKMPK